MLQTNKQYELRVNGAKLIADISGALYWPAAAALIVADLHFEKGSAYAARGVALPPYDTAATLARLEKVIAHYRPEKLISLGDSFHDDLWGERMGRETRENLLTLLAGLEVLWVTGNHDPTPPKGLPGLAAETFQLCHDGALVMRHEPLSRHDAAFEAGELAGHLHPCGKIRQRGRYLRRRCFIADGTRAILPAFGALTGSLNVRDAAFDDLFGARNYEVVMLGQEQVAPVAPHRLLPDR